MSSAQWVFLGTQSGRGGEGNGLAIGKTWSFPTPAPSAELCVGYGLPADCTEGLAFFGTVFKRNYYDNGIWLFSWFKMPSPCLTT